LETRPNSADLPALLCRLGPGMALTVPVAWIDRNFPGRLLDQMTALEKIASEHHCILRHGHGVQIFEKQIVPYTG
jgi:hypothetical protein